MKLAERVDKIEVALVTHLEESGSIRTDLAWLKKAFWTLATAVIVATIAQLLKPTQGAYRESNLSKMQSKQGSVRGS